MTSFQIALLSRNLEGKMQIVTIPFEIADRLVERVRGAPCHATVVANTVTHRITTFRSTTDRIHDRGPIII